MTLPRRLALVLLAMVALVARGGATRASAPGTTAEARPNLVLILTDDQTVEELRVMSQTLRLVASEGTTFASSYVSYPLCCPSRATLLTGQYAHNHGVRSNHPPGGGVTALDPTETLPVWLQRAGYYTAHVGKYLNGYGEIVPPSVPPGWSRWLGLIDPSTYELWDYDVSDDGVVVHHGNAPEEYQTDVLARAAEAVVRERAGKGPFFLSIAPVAPHLERSDENGRGEPPRAAPRHAGAFAHEPLPANPAFDEADVADKPAYVRRQPRIGAAARGRIERVYRAELASLLAVDDLVARVVGALADTGELDRTVVLFTSDNGFFHGEHRLREGKFLPYEESVRVPLLVRGPGFPAGAVARQLVANADLAATLVDLAAATPGRRLDGLSLRALASDPRAGADRALLLEAMEGNRPAYRAIRTGRWKWVEYANGARELYDLAADPYELRSLHAAKSTARTRRQLAAHLAKLAACAGDGCR